MQWIPQWLQTYNSPQRYHLSAGMYVLQSFLHLSPLFIKMLGQFLDPGQAVSTQVNILSKCREVLLLA